MEYNARLKREYRKISITLDKDILDQLEIDRQQTGIPISGNITKALRHKQEQTTIMINQQEQIEMLKKLITEHNQKITQKEQELQEKEKELELYNKQKKRRYFEKVIRAIFSIED